MQNICTYQRWQFENIENDINYNPDSRISKCDQCDIQSLALCRNHTPLASHIRGQTWSVSWQVTARWSYYVVFSSGMTARRLCLFSQKWIIIRQSLFLINGWFFNIWLLQNFFKLCFICVTRFIISVTLKTMDYFYSVWQITF